MSVTTSRLPNRETFIIWPEFCLVVRKLHGTCQVDTIQDFLWNLGMKPHKYAFSRNKHFFTKSCHCQTYYLCTGFTEVLDNFDRSSDDMI